MKKRARLTYYLRFCLGHEFVAPSTILVDATPTSVRCELLNSTNKQTRPTGLLGYRVCLPFRCRETETSCTFWGVEVPEPMLG
jgi:hypothetical protein